MKTEQVKIFHTNDVHSCFNSWARITDHLKRKRMKNTLYIDLGDHTDRSHPLTEATKGKGNVLLLNEAGADYVTIGNNEGITFAKDQLEDLYSEANFTVILANLFHSNGDRPSWVQASAIHTLENGLKIGMLGVTAPFTYFYEQLGWKIKPPKEVLAEMLPSLCEQADIVILLSHLGLFRDEEIAAEFEGIDVIIGAHTHHVIHNGKRVVGTLIAQTGKHGAYLGEITIDYSLEQRQVTRSQAQLLDVKNGYEDERTSKLLKTLNSKAKDVLDEQIANVPKRLDVHWQENTEITQLLCDSLTEWCHEKIGMMNAGVLLEPIEKGRLTIGDIHRICPHPINPCVVTLTGEQLEKTIERAHTDEIKNLELKGFGFRGKILGKMVFTGIDVTFSSDQLVQDVTVLGERLKKDQLYSLATLDMYTFGYLFPAIAESADKKYFMPEFLRDVLSWTIRRHWP